MSNYCINLNPPEPMTCVKVPVLKPLHKCWLIDDTLMFFSQDGISKKDLECLLGYRPSYKTLTLIELLRTYDLVETSCLQMVLVDSKVHPGRIYSWLYENYLMELPLALREVQEGRGLDDMVTVRHKYNYGYMGCGCPNVRKPMVTPPPPPFPYEQSSQCICIEYKGKLLHFTTNTPLSNLLVERVLREREVGSIGSLLLNLHPILIEPSVIGVINGVLD